MEEELLSHHLSNLEQIAQGAEARVYACSFLGMPTILKQRFSKKYRHPILDKRITDKRVQGEARMIMKCRKLGLDVPTVYFVDLKEMSLFLERVEGMSVKDFLLSSKDEEEGKALCAQIGKCLAIMHDGDIIHGDLTTSNMIIRASTRSICLIDFGLSYTSSWIEHKAVDLYVLERAFLSTHPNSETLVEALLFSYLEFSKKSGAVLTKLDIVRSRGRKRTMVG
eukprot:TRINITY_DN14742_c0_g1_i1.p1 TRINITY_DN14742_c0_g1~~TRINITY_DN14742_c0_g1_i1.p1  ORF type:complete len:224 (-),score=43.11 TRINITY_DN14742_c0_g1_i1:91-762(-)